jgi:hypothetical protein
MTGGLFAMLLMPAKVIFMYRYFETSASSGEGVVPMFETLFEQILQKTRLNAW